MAEPIIITIVVAIIAASPGVFAVWRQSRRDKADAAAALSQAAVEQLEFYRKEVADMRLELDTLKDDLEKERVKRRELERLNEQKDVKIAEMQEEIDGLRAEVEALQKGRRVR